MVAKDLRQVAAASAYPLDAFLFVQRGLDYTVRRTHGSRAERRDADRDTCHVTGQQLCDGLKAYARQEYGLLARTVLRRWRVYSCEDFGRIVFAMVDAGLMHKTDDDTMDDFVGAFNFDETFDDVLTIGESA